MGMAMSGWQAWLLSERPESRRQAALGRAYAVWRVFARNRLALAGLAICWPT
jgi:peptide/nickel transport system permease protein